MEPNQNKIKWESVEKRMSYQQYRSLHYRGKPTKHKTPVLQKAFTVHYPIPALDPHNTFVKEEQPPLFDMPPIPPVLSKVVGVTVGSGYLKRKREQELYGLADSTDCPF